jgi:hypothetical protein
LIAGPVLGGRPFPPAEGLGEAETRLAPIEALFTNLIKPGGQSYGGWKQAETPQHAEGCVSPVLFE